LGLIHIRITGLELSLPRALATNLENTRLSFSEAKLPRDLSLRLEIVNGLLKRTPPSTAPEGASPEPGPGPSPGSGPDPDNVSKLDFTLETESLATSFSSRKFKLITGDSFENDNDRIHDRVGGHGREIHEFHFENMAQLLTVLREHQTK